MTLDRKKVIRLIIGALIGILVACLPFPAALTRTSMITLGILVATILWVSLGAVPDYLAFFLMSVLFVVTGCATTKVSFSIFASDTFWILVGALGLGAACEKCGLLKRVTLHVMSLFPTTFTGQCVGLIATGIVVGPFIPSSSAKSAILGPLTRGISHSMGYKNYSKGSAGLFAAFYTSTVLLAPIFLSASFIAYSALALISDYPISWTQWFLYALPWSIVFTVLFTICIIVMYKPSKSEETTITKDGIKQQIKDLPPMSRNEKLVAAVMVICLILWILERQIGIASAMVACAALIVLMIAGIFEKSDFRTKIPWESCVYLGCLMGIGSVLGGVGINSFISEVMGPIMMPLLSNIWLFVPLFCILYFIIRLVVASWLAAITLCAVMLVPLCPAAGIHPFIIIFLTYVCGCTFNTIYQTGGYVVAHTCVQNELAEHKQMVPLSFVYQIVSIIACMACIPFWQMLGLIA